MNINNANLRIRLRDELIKEAKIHTERNRRGGYGPNPAGNHPNNYDYSANLIQQIALKALKIDLPRTSKAQWHDGPGQRVKVERLFRADLIFFSPKGGDEAIHVGIYIGQRMMINVHVDGWVQLDNIDNFKHYFGLRVLGGRRLIHS